MAPEYSESHLAHGFWYFANKQYPEAEIDFFKALEIDPKLAPAYHYLARCKIFQGQSLDAAEYFTKSMELNIEDYESPLLAVALYSKSDDQENAIKHAKIGVERVRKHVENSITSKRWIEHDPDMESIRNLPRYQIVVNSLEN